MSSFVRNRNPVLAGIEVVDQQTGKISGHAVVITTYNSSNNVYGYYDPADEKHEIHYLSASSFRFTVGVTGVK